MALSNVRESRYLILEPQRLSVASQVVDVHVLAGHVCQELRPVWAERHVRRCDGGHAALAHGVEIGARIRDVPRAEIGQVPGHRFLLDLSDRGRETHDPPIVEADVRVECPHGHLLRADGIDGETLALGAGGVGVAAGLQVQEDVAT